MACFSTIGLWISLGSIVGIVIKGKDLKDFYLRNKLLSWILIIMILRSLIDFNC